jgi:hypothetical protein
MSIPTPAVRSEQEASPVVSLDKAAGARLIARSFYKEMRTNGYTPSQLLALSNELLDLITQDLESSRKGAA